MLLAHRIRLDATDAQRDDFARAAGTARRVWNWALGIEDLHVKGMLAKARLARAVADVGFHEIRRQLAYKARRHCTRLVVADRWFPSSKLCSARSWKHAGLQLGDRSWTCCGCGAVHQRDHNAALKLQRLATATALPVASQTATPGTPSGHAPEGGGEVRPVRHEHGQQDGSGQEQNGVRT